MMVEKKFFLQILSDFLNGRPSFLIEGIDWTIISRYSRAHQVESMIFFQCRHFMPCHIASRFEQSYSTILFYFKNRERLLLEIGLAFKESGIPFLSVKGIEVAYCYPVPALRTMGDIDILVHKEDKVKAGYVLERKGFTIREKNPDYDWACYFNGMQFELHHNLIYQETVTQDVQASFFNDYWKYQENGHLDWNFHFLFLLAHIRKHLMNQGVGFRMFMDLAAVIENQKLKWEWIKEKLEQLEMVRFAQVCFGLIENWFGIKAQLPLPNLEESFIENATEKVLADGIFGFDSEDNGSNSAVNHLTKDGQYKRYSRIFYFSRLLFPPYNNMANSPFYHFVRGRSWLLPVAWIYRILRLICGKTRRLKTILKKIMTPKETIDKREHELKQWGLK